MSFQFGFALEGEKATDEVILSECSSFQTVRVADKSNILKEIYQMSELPMFQTKSIGKRMYKQVTEDIKVTSIDITSDLIPGVYEGGFKVWECSLDLSILIFDEDFTHLFRSAPDERRLKALELGCGHGWPGIALLSKGCEVVFSDFNEEALLFTWGNISLNFPDRAVSARCFSGDWLALSELLDGDE